MDGRMNGWTHEWTAVQPSIFISSHSYKHCSRIHIWLDSKTKNQQRGRFELKKKINLQNPLSLGHCTFCSQRWPKPKDHKLSYLWSNSSLQLLLLFIVWIELAIDGVYLLALSWFLWSCHFNSSSANNNDNNVILMSSIQEISFYQQTMLLDTVFIVHILI